MLSINPLQVSTPIFSHSASTCSPNLLNTFWRLFILCKLPLQVRPQVLNWIEAWRLSWPLQDLKNMVFKPGLSLFASVLWIVILLEDHIIYNFATIGKGFLQLLLYNLAVELDIHPPINLGSPISSMNLHHKAVKAFLYTHLHSSEVK